jgi:hypothetical protein
MRYLIAWLEDGYCSITVANHGLIMLIRFVTQSYTHMWKGFANKHHLVLHASKIPGRKKTWASYLSHWQRVYRGLFPLQPHLCIPLCTNLCHLTSVDKILPYKRAFYSWHCNFWSLLFWNMTLQFLVPSNMPLNMYEDYTETQLQAYAMMYISWHLHFPVNDVRALLVLPPPIFSHSAAPSRALARLWGSSTLHVRAIVGEWVTSTSRATIELGLTPRLSWASSARL